MLFDFISFCPFFLTFTGWFLFFLGVCGLPLSTEEWNRELSRIFVNSVESSSMSTYYYCTYLSRGLCRDGQQYCSVHGNINLFRIYKFPQEQ
jgi:hypothetical protein